MLPCFHSTSGDNGVITKFFEDYNKAVRPGFGEFNNSHIYDSHPMRVTGPYARLMRVLSFRISHNTLSAVVMFQHSSSCNFSHLSAAVCLFVHCLVRWICYNQKSNLYIFSLTSQIIFKLLDLKFTSILCTCNCVCSACSAWCSVLYQEQVTLLVN